MPERAGRVAPDRPATGPGRATATLDEAGVRAWGRRIGAEVRPPIWIALSGALGAGKSVLARAIGEGAGVAEPMPSPSYNLAFRYPTPSGREVVHLDLYRLSSPDEVWELGWGALGAEHEIVLVEWPERAGDLVPRDHWRVTLAVPPDRPDVRAIEAVAVGEPPHIPPPSGEGA